MAKLHKCQTTVFLTVPIIQEGTSHFIAELHIQQVRKLVLEMIQRLPANDLLKPYVKNILSLTFKLLGN